MPLINLKVQHGRPFEEAKARLGRAVGDLQGKFGAMVRTVEWSSDRDSVALGGPGFKLDVRVDASEVHVVGDLPLLASLLGGSNGVKQMIESAFRKQLKP